MKTAENVHRTDIYLTNQNVAQNIKRNVNHNTRYAGVVIHNLIIKNPIKRAHLVVTFVKQIQ